MMNIKTSWVICFNEEHNKVLITKRAKGINNPDQWCFPGGHVDDGEKSKDAAVRELAEETNITVSRDDLVKLGKLNTKTKTRKYYIVPTPMIDVKDFISGEVSKLKWVNLDKLKDIDNKHSSITSFLKNEDIVTQLNKYVKELNKKDENNHTSKLLAIKSKLLGRT